MLSASKVDKKQYFKEQTKLYLEKDENLDNFLSIKKEYEDAYKARKAKVDTLYDEIKKIKKLKI